MYVYTHTHCLKTMQVVESYNRDSHSPLNVSCGLDLPFRVSTQRTMIARMMITATTARTAQTTIKDTRIIVSVVFGRVWLLGVSKGDTGRYEDGGMDIV